ncbi:MAG: DNA glycosylase AlkZ-like family protein [Nocardioidaceae bacterium]
MNERTHEMLEQQVRAWIRTGETYRVEFKSEHRKPLNDRDLVEVVVCLANGSGGVLVVGVEDDGSITGSRPRHEGDRTDSLRVQALIANQTQPPVTTDVQTVRMDNVDLLVVEVPDVTRVVGTSQGTYVRRAFGGDGRPMCVPYHAHEMLASEIDRGAIDFARLPARGAGWDDLDPFEFERVRRLVTDASGRADQVLADLSDREIAHALGAGHPDEEVSIGSLLLFGKPDALRRFVPTHEAAFQVLRNLEVEVNDFLPYPLFRLAEEIFDRFKVRNSQEEVQSGLFRLAVPAYSETAFREALANALTHRDYTRRGAVHVQWSEDQLEISSPGGFPEGVRLDNLLVAPPTPRSPVLADAFKRAGLVERTGRGISRMFAEQLRVGRPAPDYGRTTDQQVVAVLPGGAANLAMTRWVYEQDRGDRPLRLTELQVLSELLTERRATTGELAGLTQRTESEMRTQLARMVEKGWIEARGERKGRTWHLSAPVYRALESSAGYVRVRGFDRLQQDQMVLAYVGAHGRITRGETADLCSLTPKQATRVLARLVEAGQLTLHGQRKSSYYELPPDAGGQP